MKFLKPNSGSISIFVLIFGVVFSVVIGSMVTYGSLEYTSSQRTEAHQKALAIAEAGVYYYRWHLAHAPTDYEDGTNAPGPYVHEYHDPESGEIGAYSLEITPPAEGSQIVTIKSTGYTNQFPNLRRTVVAKFGPEPLTKFSFLHNANVWFGQGLSVYGEVLSNGGIRFDGTNESIIRSSRETYTCGSETGCNPSQTRPGIWGSGGPSELWEFPVPVFDFDSVVTDFNQMRLAAQTSGRYYGPSGAYGYRIRFNVDGTATVYRVTSASNYQGYSVENGCENLYQNITNTQTLGTYPLATNKVFYFEDTVWADGTVNGNTTVVAARLPVNSYTTNMWINGNITYASQDDTNNLGLIAQNNIMYIRNVPNDFVINAAMMAQSGRIMRHYYRQSGCGSNATWAVRDSLEVFGSVISNQKSYWNFMSGGNLLSGFETRDISFNQQAAQVPPPYFPTTETYRILSWEEE